MTDENIATIDFRLSGAAYVATLGIDYRWRCTGPPALRAALNLGFPVIDRSPARGIPGMTEAALAANFLKGTLRPSPARPSPPGTIY